jgi:hypothetical protein
MKVTIELSDAQAAALEAVGVDTTKQINEFANVAINNKMKSTVMNALKRVVVDGEAQYKAICKHYPLEFSASEFIAKASANYYRVAQALGGRTMKPLDELIRDILAGDSAIEE